jgi:hypothetical protein
MLFNITYVNAAQNQENLTLTCHGLALGVTDILVP